MRTFASSIPPAGTISPTPVNHALNGLEGGIAMAGGMLLGIRRDEDQRARLESEYKGQLDFQSKMVQAKREGRMEGRQEGRKEGRKEGRQDKP